MRALFTTWNMMWQIKNDKLLSDGNFVDQHIILLLPFTFFKLQSLMALYRSMYTWLINQFCNCIPICTYQNRRPHKDVHNIMLVKWWSVFKLGKLEFTIRVSPRNTKHLIFHDIWFCMPLSSWDPNFYWPMWAYIFKVNPIQFG